MDRNVREMKPAETDLMINYFLQADDAYLKRLGVDRDKLPSLDEWREILTRDFQEPVEKRKLYYLLWEINGTPVGHSHIARIVYGREAYMHLHLWDPENCKTGNGTWFIGESIKKYFEKFNLNELYCEPHALNPAPNRTLPKVGFELLKTYDTTPGWINFHQPVNRWRLIKENFFNE